MRHNYPDDGGRDNLLNVRLQLHTYTADCQRSLQCIQPPSKLQIIQSAYCVTVPTYQGETLKLSKITRSEMGAYLCIATNGFPPSVSKRIMVNVHCKFHVITHCLLQGVSFKTQALYINPFTHKTTKPIAILDSCSRIPLLQLMHCLKSVRP
jgi:hypothetical protein